MVQFLASNLKSDISYIDTSRHMKNKVGENRKFQCISLPYTIKINPTEGGKIMSCYTSRTYEHLAIKDTLFLSPTESLNWLREGHAFSSLSIKT